MLESYWGLKESPFRGQDRTRFFYASPTHAEALARLGFLVDSGSQLGIFCGQDGCGRTTIQEVFARETRRRGVAVCTLNLLGLDQRSFLWSLAAGLRSNPKSADEPFQLWQQATDRIRQNAFQGRTTVLLLDDVDHASHDVLVQILRLLKSDLRRLTILMTLEASRMTRLGSDLLQLSQLRIRLEPWSLEDTQTYLENSLAAVGCEGTIFEETAIRRLHELTDGIPRWVNQLAELALLAAAGGQDDSISGSLVESVYQQLSESFEDEQVGAY